VAINIKQTKKHEQI